MGLDRIPKKFKGVKGLTSHERFPEPLEKGILRAKHQLPTFKAGTIRFDMIDVPVTHFRPRDIGTDVEVGKIDGHQKRIGAKVVKFPFYDPEKLRVKS